VAARSVALGTGIVLPQLNEGKKRFLQWRLAAIIAAFDRTGRHAMANNSMLTPAQLQTLAPQLQLYVQQQLGIELGQFDAQFLLDFIADKIGKDIYNKALDDAQLALAARMESLQAAIWELEK
jgi:uncharacterized protein (DUF2164 family)